MALTLGKSPRAFPGPQPLASSGDWDGGAPMQQQPAPAPGGMPGQRAIPFAGGGGAVGGGIDYTKIHAMTAGAATRPGGGAGGPSWLQMLLGPQSAPASAAPAPTDPPDPTRDQRMAANTARGNQLRAANTTSNALSVGVPVRRMNQNLTIAPGMNGGNGGLLGGGAGGGGTGNVGDALQGAMDKANAANELRYTQLLKMSGQLSDAALTREGQTRDAELGRVQQDAIGAGLGNSTVLPTLERGVYDQSAMRQAQIGDQGLRTAMGIVERRTDQGPDYATIARLSTMPGATGGGGYGGYGGRGGGAFTFPSGPAAGGGGGGGVGSGNFWRSRGRDPGTAFNVNTGTSSNNNGWGSQIQTQPSYDEADAAGMTLADGVYDGTGVPRDMRWQQYTY